MKLLVDMNLSPKWAGFLSAAGFKATHWSALGAANAPDGEIMHWARETDCVVLTSDLDFGTILAVTHGEKPSVVQLRSDNLSHENIGKQVVDALRQLESELNSGALVTIEPERTRLRILPLRTNTEK
jgi:predicted nuclease of predicted toxin-antitoxin system